MTGIASLRRALAGAGASRDETPPVVPGNAFEEADRPGAVWFVERLVHPRGAGTPHVVIRHERIRDERRLLALATLTDPARFRCLSADTAPLAQTAAEHRGERVRTPFSHVSAG